MSMKYSYTQNLQHFKSFFFDALLVFLQTEKGQITNKTVK